ncbi:MAG: hypothetical protein L0H81_08720, partial [Actinomyces sp.]|nr:hypothetical protein [Actinomyces sp.]
MTSIPSWWAAKSSRTIGSGASRELQDEGQVVGQLVPVLFEADGAHEVPEAEDGDTALTGVPGGVVGQVEGAAPLLVEGVDIGLLHGARADLLRPVEVGLDV